MEAKALAEVRAMGRLAVLKEGDESANRRSMMLVLFGRKDETKQRLTFGWLRLVISKQQDTKRDPNDLPMHRNMSVTNTSENSIRFVCIFETGALQVSMFTSCFARILRASERRSKFRTQACH